MLPSILPLRAGWVLLGLASVAVTHAAPCMPGTRALFDFQVGDVFQYGQLSEREVDGKGFWTQTYRKLVILRRIEGAESLAYETDIRERRRMAASGSPNVEIQYDRFREIQAYPDGPAGLFNACDGDTVPMPKGPETAEAFRTEVKSARYTGDSAIFPLVKPDQRMKVFGDPLLTPAGDWVQDRYLYKDYAEGVGLVKMMQIVVGKPLFDSLSLIGYVKGRDTVGVVHPDEEYEPTTALRAGMPARTGRSGFRFRVDPLGRFHPPSLVPGLPLWPAEGN